MALITHIEAGFQRQLKTGVVFVDLSAAYDTMWSNRLMLMFMRTVSCVKISNLFNNMASIKQWFPARQRFSSDIFNLSLKDLPSSSLNLFQYADDIALTHQARKFEE
jgi:hypothetical protein